MTTIKNSDIQGPPFGCPECATEGKRTTFGGRGALGSHRFSVHEVNGTSTGSRAYKSGKLAHKAASRTYVKRTSKRGPYNKAPKTNPLVAMLNDPTQFVSELDFMISEKNEQVASLYTEITALKSSIALLERYRSTFAPEVIHETQSPFATVA